MTAINQGVSAPGRIPELDGLRGIAIGMVLICHYLQFDLNARHGSLTAYLVGLTGLSWSGVDLFFILSGFLIGGILLDARDSPNYFRVFYTRRFFRIVPIYAVVLLLFPITAMLVSPATFRSVAWLFDKPMPWVSYATFTQNFWMARQNVEGAVWLAPTWSLAVEEQFYLTLPVLIALLPRRKLVTVLLAVICGATLMRIALVSVWRPNVMAELTVMPCRADALMLGVLAAVALRDPHWRRHIARNQKRFYWIFAILALGVAFLGRFAPGISFPLMRSVGFTWLALFYVSLLLFSLMWPKSWLSRSLRNRCLMGLGSIAYGVYLIHEPIRGLVSAATGHVPAIREWSDLVYMVGALAITLTVAWFSWTYFEKPLVRFGHRWQYQRQARTSKVEASLVHLRTTTEARITKSGRATHEI